MKDEILQGRRHITRKTTLYKEDDILQGRQYISRKMTYYKGDGILQGIGHNITRKKIYHRGRRHIKRKTAY